MDSLAKKEIIIMGPPVRCARHDITLPGHMRTNVITLENMFQPSYLTEIQIWLGSWYLRHRMPKKKRCDTDWRDDIVRFSRIELWKRVLKQEFIINPREWRGGGWWIQQHFVKISKKMDFHNYVNKELTFVISNDIMMYARGKQTQLNIDWKVHPNMGWVALSMFRMVIQ